MRQSSLLKRRERDIMKSEAILLLFSCIDHLCKGKKLLFVSLIPYKIDVPKITFAKQAFYDVMLVYHCPRRERNLRFLHVILLMLFTCRPLKKLTQRLV